MQKDINTEVEALREGLLCLSQFVGAACGDIASTRTIFAQHFDDLIESFRQRGGVPTLEVMDAVRKGLNTSLIIPALKKPVPPSDPLS